MSRRERPSIPFVRPLQIIIIMAVTWGVLYAAFYGWRRQPIIRPAAATAVPTPVESLPATEIIPDYQIPPVKNGLAPILDKIPTDQPVVFLGIDDGFTKLAGNAELLRSRHIKASLYLTYDQIKDRPDYFKPFVADGSVIENHTMDHQRLTLLSYAEQKAEICQTADAYESVYGRRPELFRPPYGSYNDNTRAAAAACGMKAVILWSAKANGGSMQYQTGDHLLPGDIVLMHFRPEFADDLRAFTTAAQQAGLQVQLLEDWLTVTKPD